MKGSIVLLFFFLSVLVLSGCSQPKPPGPAERIGKALDEISSAINDYEDSRITHKDNNSSDEEPIQQDVADCDPLYDETCDDLDF